jgi:hypothetical protein
MLEVDLGKVAGDPQVELGRILRYWGGSMKQVELVDGASQTLMDSGYSPVGQWRITS